MKKLIIAAAIVCAAVMSQGAQLKWSLTAVPNSPDTTVAAGWKGYWMDGSTYNAFLALSADQIAAYVVANALDDADMTTRSGAGSFNGTFGNWTYIDEDHPQYVKGYIVVFDSSTPASAGHYANTEVLTSKVPSSGNMTPGGTFATVAGGWQAIAVPEPTSGLLMLLGMAGLALRRRRA